MSTYITDILWISSSPPYSKISTAGGQTFNYYFKNIASDERFKVRLISLVDSMQKDAVKSEMKEISYKLIASEISWKKVINIDSRCNPWTKYAGLISNYRALRILDEVKKYKSEGYVPDVIILEWTNTVVLANEIKKIFPNSKLVASEHDVTFVGYARKKDYYRGIKKILWQIKYKKEKKLEIDCLKACDLIVPQNSDNVNLLVEEGIERNKMDHIVPYFNNMKRCARKSNKKDILFFGAMSRPENYLSAIWFIENVMPLLADLNIRFVVLGSNPPEELARFESERVHITGFVQSIEPFFEQSMCLVAPLVLGAGIKVKVIEALPSGIPVLTNKIGIEGIPAENRKHYLHCETPEEYSDYIHGLIMGRVSEEKLCLNSKRFIEERYSIEDSINNYKKRLSIMGGEK